ncbi:Fol3p [Saccharomyces cerevisiae x Saccharomyces kudriavzevii VIN7]|uniref:Dihydrofolate synthetase n=1 Tax=Saccharomyces cerevisiae x Saccharomyces kudriavzevii (strain VIN7) TaxID=1095631 RepID=H0GZC6_SACCK|nr:Fol3p [Saccharomyces cerevisiae x Saccharomyces kudriavzevii VIN7]
MAIELGLSRITRLLEHLGNPQNSLRVLHVAGTNGKGSVCSYLSSVLQQTPYQIGRFTTPHLVHVTDSITINNKPISLDKYQDIRLQLDSLNKSHSLKCTEFELLTCAAFKYFCDLQCQWCVIEVGLGGRLDATNAIPGTNKACCGITKIGLDHESFLGNTLAEISKEKAGIITKGVPFTVIDGTNDPSVVKVVKDTCKALGSKLFITDSHLNGNIIDTKAWGCFNLAKLPLNGEYQIFNLRVAMGMLDYLQLNGLIDVTKDEVSARLAKVDWPGRLYRMDYCYDRLSRKTLPILMDGAHNGSASIELAKYLRKEYGDQPLTFVVAVTSGKCLKPLLQPLLRPVDRIILTRFNSVEGMPWIHATDPEEMKDFILSQDYTRDVAIENNLRRILPSLANASEGQRRPIVVCGSLYLCGELLGIHNSHLKE